MSSLPPLRAAQKEFRDVWLSLYKSTLSGAAVKLRITQTDVHWAEVEDAARLAANLTDAALEEYRKRFP